MGTRKEQTKDIKVYCKFIRKCKKHPWLFKAPVRYIERLLMPYHYTLPRGQYYGKVLQELGLTPSRPLSYYSEELMSDELLRKSFFDAVSCDAGCDQNAFYAKRFSRENYVVNYYALIRETKPKIVIETGTSLGDLTSWVLSAMHKNNCGKLLSIDIPPKDGELTMNVSLSTDEVGKLIPHAYRDRWEYHAGDAKVLLPKLLLENEVDVFIHDSLHTRTHMLYEYNCARALMKPNTVIVSHDILWNKAFFSFTASHNLKGLSCISDPNLGLTVNKFDSYEEDIGVGVVEIV